MNVQLSFLDRHAGEKNGRHPVRDSKKRSRRPPASSFSCRVIRGKEQRRALTNPHPRVIDNLVYQLYDLSRDEIAIVEEGTQKAKSA